MGWSQPRIGCSCRRSNRVRVYMRPSFRTSDRVVHRAQLATARSSSMYARNRLAMDRLRALAT